jgi:hypothetical protein
VNARNELEVIDDYTITLKFAGPNGLAVRVGMALHGNSGRWDLSVSGFCNRAIIWNNFMTYIRI